ncbi:MAG: ribosome silencing factor [Polyangiaceae bacterium]
MDTTQIEGGPVAPSSKVDFFHHTSLDAPDDLSELPEATASDEAKRLALAIASAGLDKKATGIEIIDVSAKVDYTQLLVLMSGRRDRHVHAIASGVQRELKEKLGVAPLSVEGLTTSQWVLLDFNDVVVHVFQEDSRCFYDLEGLWIDAQRVVVPEPPQRRASEQVPE